MTKLINLSSLEAELLSVKESLKELNAKRQTHLNIAAELKAQIKSIEQTVKHVEKVLHQWVTAPTKESNEKG